MNKVIACVLVATAALAAGTARAGGVSWSIDINTPGIGTVISNGPVYQVPAYQVPVYVQAPAYAAVPVYADPYQAEYRTVYRSEYRPEYRPVYRDGYRPDYRPAHRPVPIVYERVGGRHWDRDEHRHEGRRHERDERDERHERWHR